MCGIIATHTAGKFGFYPAEIQQFKQMLILTSFRGIDGTGLAGADYINGVDVVKAVDNPYNLLAYNKANDFFNLFLNDYRTVLGHCRYSTMGAVDALSAHPFQEGAITLIHNGVIRNFKELKGDRVVSVDSHLVACLLNEKPAKEVIESLQGAYVLMWIDTRDNSFNIARNKERPLFVATNKTKTTLVFSSEKATLTWNNVRNSAEYSEIEEIPAFEILKYKEGSIIPESEAFVEKVPKTVYSNTIHYGATYKPHYTEYTKPSNVMLNSEICISMLDYTRTDNTTTIEGISDQYPNVLFKTFVNSFVDDAIFQSFDGMIGVTKSIHPTRNEEYDWICWLQLTKFEAEPITLYDTLDKPVVFSKEKVLQMLKEPCFWCNNLHLPNSENSLDSLYYENYGTEQGLVCISCCTSPGANYGS
jgi:Glutamine amidotransferase domain